MKEHGILAQLGASSNPALSATMPDVFITDTGTKKWELRIVVRGRRRQLGLGVYPAVTLEEARAKAGQIRLGASEGRDVASEWKQAERVAAKCARSITYPRRLRGLLRDKGAAALQREAQGAMAVDHASLCVPVDRQASGGRNYCG